MVGLDGVEPSTSRLSGVRSNQSELQAHLYGLSASAPLKAALFLKDQYLNLSKLNSDSILNRTSSSFLRKEVIQPLVPQRLPCYDFTPIISHTLGACPPCGLAQRLLVQPTLMV
jgi:hypothetical protein